MTRARHPSRTAPATATRRKPARGGPAGSKPSRAVAKKRESARGSERARPAEPAEEPEHAIQPTAAAIEAERTGILPLQARPSPRSQQIPGPEADTMRGGDADVSPLDNEYSGEEMPGGSMPAPDQNRVDDIGRAYGVEEEDTGSLRTSAELLSRRDRHRRE